MDFTEADLEYVRANYLTLADACQGRPETPADVHRLAYRRLLPGPAYVAPDGTEYVPRDYFALADEAGGPARLEAWFRERVGDIEEWDAYLTGLYAVCLRDVRPATILRKSALVESLRALLAEPRPDDDEWRQRLRTEVDELDELERPFSPDLDRVRFGKPPTRDELVEGPRRSYPDVFRTVPA
jgi:hypothetical protein